MVWILLLSDMDLSTHALTPGITIVRIRSLSGLDRRRSPRIQSVAFGEYELSPSLISLSPLPSSHWNTFQRITMRTSSWCYPTFILDKGRSLGFASTSSDSTPFSDSLSLRLRASSHLTLPLTVTRRFIMQKARRHILRCSDRL